MPEINLGRLDGRQLTMRFFVPFRMQAWTGDEWRLSAWRLANPVNWFRSIFSKWNWRASCHWCDYATHRCYCNTGNLCDGGVTLAGWGLVWFYSHYTGDVPCTCDRVIEELETGRATAEAVMGGSDVR